MNALRTILIYAASIAAVAALTVLIYPHYKAAPVELQSAFQKVAFALGLMFSIFIALNGLFHVWVALSVFDLGNLPHTLGSFLAGLVLMYLGIGLMLFFVRDAGWITVPHGFLRFPESWNVMPLAFVVLVLLFAVNVLAILCEVAWFYISSRFKRAR